MSVALEAIAKLRQKDLHKVAKTDVELIRNTSIKSERWVQWNVRKIDNVKTYYEVYNPGPNQEILWVEFHVKARTFQILESVSGLEKLLERSKDSMYGVKVDVRDMNVDAAVREVQLRLDDVYNLVEQRLKEQGATIVSMSKKMRNVRRPNTLIAQGKANNSSSPGASGDGEPWYVGWQCDEKCLDKSYDKEFKKLKKTVGLTWLPWVGDQYHTSKILVVGESNYAESDWCKFVDCDKLFVRKVSDYICIRRCNKKKGRALATIARMLSPLGVRGDEVPVGWRRIAYMDIVQRCLEDYGNKKLERPKMTDRIDGWKCVASVIETLRPKLVILMGKPAVAMIKKSFPDLICPCPDCCAMQGDEGHLHARIDNGRGGLVDVVVIPHPTSHGFSHPAWKNFLTDSFPDVAYFRQLKVVQHGETNKTVPLYAVEELKNGKKAKPVGRMRNPDLPGCVVDRKTFEKLYGVKLPK